MALRWSPRGRNRWPPYRGPKAGTVLAVLVIVGLCAWAAWIGGGLPL